MKRVIQRGWFSHVRYENSRDLIYSVVLIVNNTVMYIYILLRRWISCYIFFTKHARAHTVGGKKRWGEQGQMQSRCLDLWSLCKFLLNVIHMYFQLTFYLLLFAAIQFSSLIHR